MSEQFWISLFTAVAVVATAVQNWDARRRAAAEAARLATKVADTATTLAVSHKSEADRTNGLLTEIHRQTNGDLAALKNQLNAALQRIEELDKAARARGQKGPDQ